MDGLTIFLGIVLAIGVVMYATNDGFDLGVGILFPLAPSESDRENMMNSIAPFWDGNETWLILGGAIMFGAFPVAYATLLPAFYLPVVVMLFGLVLRGTAFEFRFRAERLVRLWDWAFAIGSLMAAFCQGLILGGFIDGVTVKNGAFAGHTFDFLSGFSLACGVGLVAGYALLGSTWLILKTAETTQAFGRFATRPMLFIVLVFMGIVSLWTPLTHPAIEHRWFAWPNIAFLSPVPIVTAGVVLALWQSVRTATSARPFLLALALFLLAFAGLGISLWPYAVPYDVTLTGAASSPASRTFVAIGVAIILPINLLYLSYAHWVFRGKQVGGYEA